MKKWLNYNSRDNKFVHGIECFYYKVIVAEDNEKLLNVFQNIVDRGNSVIIIEHNIDFIASSDWIIEMGPGGGKQGGQIVFEGTPEEMIGAETMTAKWL